MVQSAALVALAAVLVTDTAGRAAPAPSPAHRVGTHHAAHPPLPAHAAAGPASALPPMAAAAACWLATWKPGWLTGR